MIHTIQNNEFRDLAAQARHPFAADATLTNGTLQLPDDFLVDALLYVSGAVPPFYIDSLSLNATHNALEVSISDAGANKIAIGLFDEQTADLYTLGGICAGVLVPGPGLLAVKAAVADVPALFAPGQTDFRAGACLTPTFYASGMRAAKMGDKVVTWALPLVAASGLSFESHEHHYFADTDVVPPAAGVIRISMYGEEGVIRTPVRSINGIKPDRGNPHFWLVGRHVKYHNAGSSGVRPSNSPDGAVRLCPSAGYSYGDEPLEGSNVKAG